MRRIFLAMSLIISLSACEPSGADKRPGRPPPLTLVSRPVQRDVPVEIRAPVDLRPREQADILSKQVGYLSAVLVDRGDVVKKGQLLALVRPSELPDQLQAARGQLQQAEAALEQAKQNRTRIGALAPAGVVSTQELQQSSTALSQAEAAEAAARAQLQAVAVRLGETKIESPIDGVIMQRRFDAGALVGPQNGAIVTVGRVDPLRVFVAVREQEAAKVGIGQKVLLEVDAQPGEVFSGAVVRLSPGFDPLSRTLEAEVHLPNSDGKLRPGMYGRARIQVGLHKNTLTVPESAVQLSGDQRFVFVIVDGKAQRRAVTLGVDGGTFLEIVSGLKTDDSIVVAGIDALADGSPVRTQSGTTPWQPTTAKPTPSPPAH
ncbi:MAG TPA: efflux RND transporter periplasmic adaptor subunit [Pseudomonadota bacterium]|nr:efflux RND transporter periplasmic adaptor subunit [Pseudomonadota bacterium]HNO66862.1 efflux RND transporter periplasmic adaptor subunit [Pseudomonadota bacterium]